LSRIATSTLNAVSIYLFNLPSFVQALCLAGNNGKQSLPLIDWIMSLQNCGFCQRLRNPPSNKLSVVAGNYAFMPAVQKSAKT
jgi:hypothetical protein